MAEPYVKIIGVLTGKVYAEGLKVDCFRNLHCKFKSCDPDLRANSQPRIYPEPLRVLRVVQRK